MLFTVQRWLQPGGVVLIDEPDLHLHPSLISPLLASIENIVAENGQLCDDFTRNGYLATL